MHVRTTEDRRMANLREVSPRTRGVQERRSPAKAPSAKAAAPVHTAARAAHGTVRTVHGPTHSPTRPAGSGIPKARPPFVPTSRGVRGTRVSNRVKAQNPVVCFLCDVGLPQYVDAMLRNGFDDMETLADMKEEHMKSMGFLPGHALKLKKKLAHLGGWICDAAEATPTPSLKSLPDDAMSNESALSVQQSWSEVRKLGISTVGHTFYKHMFQLVPEARNLFPMTFQHHFGEEGLFHESLAKAVASPPALVLEHFTRVLEAIGTAVAGLQNREKLAPQLTALGVKHATLGLEEKYFRVGNAALMLTLHEALGERFTTSLEESWTLVYGFMSANMISGFRDYRMKEAQVAEYRQQLRRSMKQSEKVAAKEAAKEKPSPKLLAQKIAAHLGTTPPPTPSAAVSKEESTDLPHLLRPPPHMETEKVNLLEGITAPVGRTSSVSSPVGL
ncbi:unnamed protein product [Effrenium voratum]|uniref:Globin domain-containing protein n=1 Tax=Effrenium voratum TaxID=2562239 RepID=A0AA36IU22_9DINO|nr:unnamed protein product [Effrenium voratum]